LLRCINQHHACDRQFDAHFQYSPSLLNQRRSQSPPFRHRGKFSLHAGEGEISGDVPETYTNDLFWDCLFGSVRAHSHHSARLARCARQAQTALRRARTMPATIETPPIACAWRWTGATTCVCAIASHPGGFMSRDSREAVACQQAWRGLFRRLHRDHSHLRRELVHDNPGRWRPGSGRPITKRSRATLTPAKTMALCSHDWR